MVDPHYVIHPKAVFHPPDPPFIAGFLMISPIIKRISPKLPRLCKGIRRTARYCLWQIFLIKLKQLRMAPAVRAVKSYIDGNISDDPDPLFIGIIF